MLVRELVMRGSPFGPPSIDMEVTTLVKDNPIVISGWMQVDGGPKWFRVERIQGFAWVSGYIIEGKKLVKTIRNDDSSCHDIYDTTVPPDPLAHKIEDQINDVGLPLLKKMNSLNYGCEAQMRLDKMKVYDTPFEMFHGERSYGKFDINAVIPFTGWYQTDNGTLWLRMSLYGQHFWIKGLEMINNKDEPVIEATNRCQGDNLYSDDYRLSP